MDQSVHELIQVIIRGISWVLHTIELLWDWSWNQITRAFSMPWTDLPTWKLCLGVLFIIILAYILYELARRSLAAFEKIAAAFWTMAVTLLSVLSFVILAGVFSRSFQWLVATVPDRFWEKFM